MDQPSLDEQMMRQALALARQGLYTTGCNPRVGCVLVKDGQLIGQGYHARPGEGHAEVNAIADALANADTQNSAKPEIATLGATAYVTLEPCSHTGRTPPCCEALIAAGVARVVVAMVDPNPQVSGSGIDALKAAGIEVEVGLLEEEARALNPGFIKRMQQGLPYVRVKLAMSLDGRTAMASGESQWITGPAARANVQQLRAQSCAIVSGIDTVITDNAALTVRVDELVAGEACLDTTLAQQAAACQPLRVVLDSQLRLPPDARILQQPGNTLLVHSANAPEPSKLMLQQAGAELMILPQLEGRFLLEPLLRELSARGCNEVLVEAGATLAGAFVAAGLVDELVIYMAPTLLGSSAKPLLALPLETMAEQRALEIIQITPVGKDWRIVARPKRA